jgi:hypothetical protein
MRGYVIVVHFWALFGLSVSGSGIFTIDRPPEDLGLILGRQRNISLVSRARKNWCSSFSGFCLELARLKAARRSSSLVFWRVQASVAI